MSKYHVGYRIEFGKFMLFPHSPEGAAWVAKHITTNVADTIHYGENIDAGKEIIRQMAEDGLIVKECKEGEVDEDDLEDLSDDDDDAAEIDAIMDEFVDSGMEFVLDNGHKLVTRDEFEAATDVPAGLRERVAELSGAKVLYDPNDDKDGFLIVGDDENELIKGLREHIDSQVYDKPKASEKPKVDEQYDHEKCEECDVPSIPAEGVPDQALRGCPKCHNTWFEGSPQRHPDGEDDD